MPLAETSRWVYTKWFVCFLSTGYIVPLLPLSRLDSLHSPYAQLLLETLRFIALGSAVCSGYFCFVLFLK